MKLNDKKKRLIEKLRSLDSFLLAFSGGVDSTFLLAVSHEILKHRVIAVTADSFIHPSREREAAAKLAGPENGRAIDVVAMNQNKFISVRYFASPGFEVNLSTINDSDVVFTLALANGTTLDVAGPGTAVNGAYRYVLPDSFVFVPGEVTARIQEAHILIAHWWCQSMEEE